MRVVCKADSGSGNMPDKQTRDAEDLFDAEYSPRLGSGMSAGANLALRWCDKRDIDMLSMKHTPAMMTVLV